MRKSVVCLAMAGLLMLLMSGFTACGLFDWNQPSLLALGGRDHGFISRRGAHTYVGVAGTPENGAGDAAGFLNAMFAREYSDLMSHFGQYKPVLAPLVEPAGQTCVPWARRWNGTSVTQGLECDAGGILLETAYTGVDRVSVRVEFMDGWSGDTVSLRGCAADNGDGMLSSTVRDGVGRVTIDQEATLYSFWGVQARDIRRTVVEIAPKPVDGPGLEPEAAAGSAGCWMALVDPGKETVVNFGMSADWGADATFDKLGGTPVALNPDRFVSSLADLHSELAAWFDGAPILDWHDPTALMAWFLLWENTAGPWGDLWNHETVVPGKRHYFRGTWLWDAGFIAIALASGNADARALGVNQIRNIVENAAADGRFPREVWAHDAGTGYQPPGILTWAAWELAVWGDDDAILAEFYDAFVANHVWFVENTDSDGDGRCEWAREDSGMDTSPRFDDGPVEGVDLQAWLALDAQLLGWIAERIGRDMDVDAWLAEDEARRKDIRDNFWDRTDGMFYDRVIDDSAVADPFVRVVTPVTFIPLLTGAATPAQAVAVARHLDDVDFFKAPFGIPTVPTTADTYESDNYWRGPTWIVMNAFAFWGLMNYDMNEAATLLRKQTLDMMNQSVTTWEYYDSTTGRGIGSPDFMWSAVFYLKMAFLGRPPFGLDHPVAD